MNNGNSRIAGIDIGAGYTKCVISDSGGKSLSNSIIRTDPDFERSARMSLDEAGAGPALSTSSYADRKSGAGSKTEGQNSSYVITTGIGRYSVGFRNIQITDITATAKGVKALMPDVEFALDVGWQVTRAIRLNEKGQVVDFKCNEKCAAGSGSFIERAVKYLEIAIEDVGRLSMEAKDPQPISSICAVLAESEIINHISEGKTIENILRGIHNSLADRSLMLLRRIGYKNDRCAIVGGLALQEGMIRACGEKFGAEVVVPPDPRHVTALGAALMAIQRLSKQKTAA